jgi:hypothetical protein
VGKVKIIGWFAMFTLVISTGWQIAVYELANVELNDDLKDLSAMGAAQIGLEGPGSDGELRESMIRACRRAHYSFSSGSDPKCDVVEQSLLQRFFSRRSIKRAWYCLDCR